MSYNKNAIDGVNGDNPMNSNFKKSFFISGSPTRERLGESCSQIASGRVTPYERSAGHLNQQNKQFKKELLSHAFHLGYGKDTHKRVASIDSSHNMKNCDSILSENQHLKKK